MIFISLGKQRLGQFDTKMTEMSLQRLIQLGAISVWRVLNRFRLSDNIYNKFDSYLAHRNAPNQIQKSSQH